MYGANNNRYGAALGEIADQVRMSHNFAVYSITTYQPSFKMVSLNSDLLVNRSGCTDRWHPPTYIYFLLPVHN